MTDAELRALVRQAIAAREGQASGPPSSSAHPGAFSTGHAAGFVPAHHVSHGLLLVPETDGPCLIEPAVTCNHCGYCKSYGH